MPLPLQISNCLINFLSPIMNCWNIRTTTKTAAFKMIFTFCLVTSKIKAPTPIFRCCLSIPDRMFSLYIFFQNHFLQGVFSSVMSVHCNYETAAVQWRGTGKALMPEIESTLIRVWWETLRAMECCTCCSRCGKITPNPSTQTGFFLFYEKLYSHKALLAMPLAKTV